jgi:hypothetical protein
VTESEHHTIRSLESLERIGHPSLERIGHPSDGLTLEKFDAFCNSLGGDRYYPDIVHVTAAWPDHKIKSLFPTGCVILCDKNTYERIEKLKNQ